MAGEAPHTPPCLRSLRPSPEPRRTGCGGRGGGACDRRCPSTHIESNLPSNAQTSALTWPRRASQQPGQEHSPAIVSRPLQQPSILPPPSSIQHPPPPLPSRNMLETPGTPAAAAALGRLEASEVPERSDGEKEGPEPRQGPTARTAGEPTTPEEKCKDEGGEEEGAKTPEEPEHPAAQQPETPKTPRTPRADVYPLAEPAFNETQHHVEWGAEPEPTTAPTAPRLSPSPEDPRSTPPCAQHSRHSRRLKPAPALAVCCHTHVTHSGCTHTESSVGRICRNVDLCADGIINDWRQMGDCDMCDDAKNLQWDMSSADEGGGGGGWESDDDDDDDDDDDEEEEEEEEEGEGEGEDKEGEEVVVVVSVVGADNKAGYEQVADSPAGNGPLRSSRKKRAHGEDGEGADPEEAQRRKRRRVSFNETLQVQYL